MQRTYEQKIKCLQRENDNLRHQILLAKRKRKEASENAKILAESNYYLERYLNKLRENSAAEIDTKVVDNENLVV
ncbi:unnamed protein product [Colias eurytheme]|nr:unnamed protein product [Colias eurytheme]